MQHVVKLAFINSYVEEKCESLTMLTLAINYESETKHLKIDTKLEILTRSTINL